MSLDPRSITLMTSLISVVMGLLLFGLRRSFPERMRATLGIWGLGPLLGLASALSYALDRFTSPLAGVVFGNGLMLAAFLCFLFGSQMLYGLRSTWRGWLAAGVPLVAALAFFLVVVPDYRIRVALHNSVVAAALLAHARLLWRHGRGFAPGFTMTVTTLQALVMLARAATTFWLDTADATRYTPSLFQLAYLTSFNFSLLLICMGVLLMASERLREEFEYLASHDGLTGALTRRAILEACATEWARWKRYGTPFSILLLDIDHFKRINDQWGHQAGDRVLAGFAECISAALRKTDRLGRYGGEEFLVLLPHADAAHALATAERLRQATAHLQQPVACTVSAGAATVQAADAGIDTLLAHADAALYRAKHQGRNQVAAHPQAAPPERPDGQANTSDT
ncbi:MAG: GGDEF domain-containing protein [Acidovorax sp.]